MSLCISVVSPFSVASCSVVRFLSQSRVMNIPPAESQQNPSRIPAESTWFLRHSPAIQFAESDHVGIPARGGVLKDLGGPRCPYKNSFLTSWSSCSCSSAPSYSSQSILCCVFFLHFLLLRYLGVATVTQMNHAKETLKRKQLKHNRPSSSCSSSSCSSSSSK